MKKALLAVLILCGSSMIISSCASDEMDEIQMTPIEKSTDGDEPKPGCNDPNGCDGKTNG